MDKNNSGGGCYIRGVCQYCGQALIVSMSETQAEADIKAAEECTCGGATRARRLKERIQNALDGIEKIFGQGSKDADYEPIGAAALDFLNAAVTLILEGNIESVSVTIPGVCRAKLLLTAKGNIKICRTEGRTRVIES